MTLRPANEPGEKGSVIATDENSRKSKVVPGSRRQLTMKRSVASIPAARMTGSPAPEAGAGAAHASVASKRDRGGHAAPPHSGDARCIGVQSRVVHPANVQLHADGV